MNNLPPPIKPRTLKRAREFDGYVTSDGRYEVRPARFGSDGRVRFWMVKDTTDCSMPADGDVHPSLEWVRQIYCAPGGKVPWLVADMDDGILRVEPTRKAAVAWAASHACAPLRERSHYGSCYDYTFGHPDEDANTCVFIMRADNAHWHGFDPVQQPLYPYPGDPHEQVDRPDDGGQE